MTGTMKCLLALGFAAMLAGCASSQKQNVYQSGQVQQSMKVDIATVIAVREVEIEARPQGVGSTAGATAGAAAATNLDTRHGLVAGIAGAVIGGVVGTMAEKAANSKSGVELVYRVDGGKDTEALVQEKDGVEYRAGDRVRLIRGSFSVRAVKL